MSEQRMANHQLKKLRRMLSYVYKNSGFYRGAFQRAGITPDEIRSLDDFYKQVPLTTKEDLRATQAEDYPFGSNRCIPYEEVSLITASTGTTGKPTYTGFSRKDLEIAKEVVKRTFWFEGARPRDVYLHAYALSNWIAGVPLIEAAVEMGMTCLPVGVPTPAQRMITMIQDQKPDIVWCTPSYAIHLAEKVREILGGEPSAFGVRMLGCGGEPGVGIPAVRQQIERAWGADVRDVLGTPEQIPCGWIECDKKHGMHALNQDFVLNELVDPVTREHIEMTDGAEGALVYTALERECAPLIRFYVADQVKVFTERCECRYPGFRLTVIGRYDDMLKIKGVKTWPSSVKDVLTTLLPEVTGEFRIMLDRKPVAFTVMGPVKLVIEYGPQVRTEELAVLKGKITERISSALSWSPETIELVPPLTLPRAEMKSKYIEILAERTASA